MYIKLPEFITAVVGVPMPIHKGWKDIAIIPGAGGSVKVTNSKGENIIASSAMTFGAGANDLSFIWDGIIFDAYVVNAQIIINGGVKVIGASSGSSGGTGNSYFPQGW